MTVCTKMLTDLGNSVVHGLYNNDISLQGVPWSVGWFEYRLRYLFDPFNFEVFGANDP